MKLIVGLGNPGEEFDNTPHNAGFAAVESIAKQINAKFSRRTKSGGVYAEGEFGGQKVVLLKPQTFMNTSGDAVFAYAKKYNLKPSDIIVLLDDFELSDGLIRARLNGTGGTHNGLKNVVLRLGTTEFARIRIGVGEPPKDQDYATFVLSKMSGERLKNVALGIEKAIALVQEWVNGKNIATTM